MGSSLRQMRLTAEHVAHVNLGVIADDGDPPPPEWATPSTPEDHAETIARLRATGPDAGDMWFFAYGSLIWKPACDFVEIRTGVVRGWHTKISPNCCSARWAGSPRRFRRAGWMW
jgi:cation transport protein ChaC